MDGANMRSSLVNSEPSLGDAEYVWEKKTGNLSSSVGYSLHVSSCLSALSHVDEDRGRQLPAASDDRKRLLPITCLSSQFVHLMVITFLFSALCEIDFFFRYCHVLISFFYIACFGHFTLALFFFLLNTVFNSIVSYGIIETLFLVKKGHIRLVL